MAERSSTETAAQPLLPRGLIVLYALAPLVMTPMLSSGFFAAVPTSSLPRDFAINYVGFFTLPLAIHIVYRTVMPRLIARCPGVVRRFAVHLAMTGVITAGVAIAIYPVIDWIGHSGPPLVTWLLRAVTTTWLIIVPALAMQELRVRAEAVERRWQDQRQAALRAELEALQARTHPHFLFNSINAVVGLIPDDPDRAIRTLEQLADVLRYALQSARRELVPLRDELAMVEDYLAIQRARFGERLRYTLDIEPGLGDLALPPMVLQPLVENAVLHGMAGGAAGGTVRVEGRRRGALLELRVNDDGPGLGGSRHAGSGTGLRDLAQRIELLYGAGGSLAVRPGALGGVTAELVLPAAGVAA
jgi:signal transduction histidine kinase